MDTAILVIDMPDCCYECFAFDDSGDHPMCLVTEEYRGYKFRAREQKMDKCPLREIPNRMICLDDRDDYADGYNDCLDEILGI